jgi:hypothetical protein
MMNFTKVGRYQHFNLCIELNFGNVSPQNFKGEIQNSGVFDMQKPNNIRVVRIEKMRAGTIRITWTPPAQPIIPTAAQA